MSSELPEELLGVGDVGLDEERDPDTEERDQEPEERERVLVFRLGQQSYGLDVGDVRNIVEVGERTRVPRSSDAIDGIMDMRGDITAVIDPRELLPVSEPPIADDRQRIVVFDRPADRQSAGIRVDVVEGVRSFPVSQIRRDEPEFEMPAGDLVKAVVEIPPEDEGEGDDAAGGEGDERPADTDPEPAERISVLHAERLVESAG